MDNNCANIRWRNGSSTLLEGSYTKCYNITSSGKLNMYTINPKATTNKPRKQVIPNQQTKEIKQNKNVQLTQKKKKRKNYR